MILTIDVGNTNITCGVFQGDEIAASFRITTKMPRTSDEYGMMLLNLLEQNDIHPTEIKDAIICSVVPNVMHSLRGGLVKYFHITPIVVEAGIKTGIRIVTPNPQQIGADRIVIFSSQSGHMKYTEVRCLSLISVPPQPMIMWMKAEPFREGSQHPESGFRQKPCGKMLQNSRRSRSKSRHQFSEKTRSQVCRQGLCTDRSDRPNTSSTA